MAKGKYEYWLTDDGLLLLSAWARDGLIDEQIAKNIGIAAATLYDWKKRYPEISEALKRGKEVVDIEVENALRKRALGYEYEEVKEEFERDILVKRTVTKKFIPPDTTAQIFWLKNRKSDEWRDKKDVKHEGSLDLRKQYENMTDEELEELGKRYERINKVQGADI